MSKCHRLSYSYCLLSCYRKLENIHNQIRRMGCSVDWDRAFFTMNEVRPFHFSSLSLSFSPFSEVVSSCEGMLCPSS